jgi:hypothetical protein
MTSWGKAFRIVGVGLALACATPPSDARVEDELRRLGAQVQGLGRTPHIVVLNAGSRMDAWGQITASQADGPSTRMQALGRRLAKGSRQRVGVVIGGPFAQLNDRMLSDALTASGRDPLPGLTLLLVSPEPPNDELRREAKRRKLNLVHRALHI